VIPSGVIQTNQEKFAVRVSGSFTSVEDLNRKSLRTIGSALNDKEGGS
jgi:hypothetical protein